MFMFRKLKEQRKKQQEENVKRKEKEKELNKYIQNFSIWMVTFHHSQSRYGLETRPNSLFNLFVRVYAGLHGEDNEFLV